MTILHITMGCHGICLRTEYEIPSSKLLFLSLIISLLGLCNIIISIFSFVERIYASGLATSLWCGTIVFIVGIIGITSSQIHRKFSMRILLVSLTIGNIFSIILLVITVNSMFSLDKLHIKESVVYISRAIMTATLVSASLSLLIISASICVCFVIRRNIPPFVRPYKISRNLRNEKYKAPTDDKYQRNMPLMDNVQTQSSLMSTYSSENAHVPQESVTFLPEDSLPILQSKYITRANIPLANQANFNANYKSLPVHQLESRKTLYRSRTDKNRQFNKHSIEYPSKDIQEKGNTVCQVDEQVFSDNHVMLQPNSSTTTNNQSDRPEVEGENLSPFMYWEEYLPPYSETPLSNDNIDIQIQGSNHDEVGAKQNEMLDDQPEDSTDREVTQINFNNNYLAAPNSSMIPSDPDVQSPQVYIATYDSGSLSLPMFLKRERHGKSVVSQHPVNQLHINEYSKDQNVITPPANKLYIHEHSGSMSNNYPHFSQRSNINSYASSDIHSDVSKELVYRENKTNLPRIDESNSVDSPFNGQRLKGNNLNNVITSYDLSRSNDSHPVDVDRHGYEDTVTDKLSYSDARWAAMLSNIDSGLLHDVGGKNSNIHKMQMFRRRDYGRLSERYPLSPTKMNSLRRISPRYASFHTSTTPSASSDYLKKFYLLAPEALNIPSQEQHPKSVLPQPKHRFHVKPRSTPEVQHHRSCDPDHPSQQSTPPRNSSLYKYIDIHK